MNTSEQTTNFKKGDYLYIQDDNVEILFIFDEVISNRYFTPKYYQIIDGEHCFKGSGYITTNQEVVEASQDIIDRFLNHPNFV